MGLTCCASRLFLGCQLILAVRWNSGGDFGSFLNFSENFFEKYWRSRIQSPCLNSFPLGKALWNLLCAIDWDPQSKFKKECRFRSAFSSVVQESLGSELSVFRRVWSWLRMNAGGVVKTCKSNGFFSCSNTIEKLVANGCVTREQSTFKWGIARRKAN